MISDERLGFTAYEAYAKTVEWKNYQGLPIPAWNLLGEQIRQAWIAAAKAVRKLSEAEASWMD